MLKVDSGHDKHAKTLVCWHPGKLWESFGFFYSCKAHHFHNDPS